MAVEAYLALWRGGPADSLYLDAVLRDPASPYRWSDLADSLLTSGDKARAAFCSRRSIMLGPNVPAILLRAMNFAILSGMKPDALAAAGRLLDLVPDRYADIVFLQLTRAGCDANDVVTQILTSHPGLARRYLSRTMSAVDVSGVANVWHWMQAHNLVDAATERQYRSFEARHMFTRGLRNP